MPPLMAASSFAGHSTPFCRGVVGGKRAPDGCGARTNVTCRLRDGREHLQAKYRQVSNPEVRDFLESVGVRRADSLPIIQLASEWRYWNNMSEEMAVPDMKAVVNYLASIGLQSDSIGKVITAHPVVLNYDVEARLKPLCDFLLKWGCDLQELPQVFISRPSLLGLDPDVNLKRIVDYLESTGTPKPEILKYILKTL